jgi:NADH:ubiquinone reductase (H+-translocating)
MASPWRGIQSAPALDSQVALIYLGCDSAVGVMGKMCIGAPTRLIYSLKSWIDRSFIRRFKV